jgi:O-6-methylguanine DNA methyltransferase
MAERDKSFSDFQKNVYRVVSTIPRGQVRSYKWVAARSGVPGASRAVGSALNKNPYPIAIPCHRVIKSDGSLGGYSRGSRAKERLLRNEGFVADV